MMGIKKFIGRIVDEAIDKRLGGERERARRGAKIRLDARLKSLGLRRLGSSAIKRKG